MAAEYRRPIRDTAPVTDISFEAQNSCCYRRRQGAKYRRPVGILWTQRRDFGCCVVRRDIPLRRKETCVRTSSIVIAILVTGCALQSDDTFVPKAFTGFPTLPPTYSNINLTPEQHGAIRDATADLLRDGATVDEIHGYKMFDGDNLRAVIYSKPINVRNSAYDVDAIGCAFYVSVRRSRSAPDNDPEWHCFYSGRLSNVYVGSVNEALRLDEGISEQDALAIFKDALATCDLDFDVPYSRKPRLSLAAGKRYLRFSAPTCHYEYRMRKGRAQRGKPFDTDTIAGGT